jgi:hypothetical protein
MRCTWQIGQTGQSELFTKACPFLQTFLIGFDIQIGPTECRRALSSSMIQSENGRCCNSAIASLTIVGEVTGEGANPFEYRRVHAHFALSLPEARSMNLMVPADQALETALSLAHDKLKK